MKGSKYRSKWFYLAAWVILFGFAFTIGGCGADTKSLVSTATGGLIDTGGGTTGTTTPTVTKKVTTIAGKIKLSSTATGGTTGLKARMKASMHPKMADAKGKPMGKVRKGVPGSVSHKLSKVVERATRYATTEATLNKVSIFLFDADHADWLYPIAQDTELDENGEFKLDKLTNAILNSSAYTDGDPIPAGIYTVVAVGVRCGTKAAVSTEFPYPDNLLTYCSGKAYNIYVGVQAFAKKYEGDIPGNDLTVSPSDSTPKVSSIMGKKLSDLTTSSGVYAIGTGIAPNAAVQVIFDMAMRRDSTPDSITLNVSGGAAVSGKWKMSPDLTVATFYPTTTLSVNTAYTVTISKDNAVNYYGKGLADNVSANYTTASVVDALSPDVESKKPKAGRTDVDISETITVEFTEAMDTNAVAISSSSRNVTTGATIADSAAIGDKPSIKYLGKNIYQIVPSNPLTVNTAYTISVSGATDLAGNVMNTTTWSFQTAATSSGVDTTQSADVQSSQAEVKGLIGKWVDAINSGDISSFGSMMSGDFTMKVGKSGTRCTDCPESYDLNKDGSLSYSEFIKFIESWFNQNAKIKDWTGDDTGVHITGKIVESLGIKVDTVTNTAAFGLEMTYVNASGGLPTGMPVEKQVIKLYVKLTFVNGSWYMVSLSEKDNTSSVGVNIATITTGEPTTGKDLTSEEKKTLTFNWTSVANVTSYAVVLTDNMDPLGNTGWVGIIDAVSGETTKSLKYSSVSDFDPSDGKLIILGGGKDAPFSKSLTLQDGGSYSWMVIGFGSLTASKFGVGVEPEADMIAQSASTGSQFTISKATLLTSKISVKLYDSTGTTKLTFKDDNFAWDAVAANEIKLQITGTGTEGKVFVYGEHYSEIPFKFGTGGTASISVNLFNGFNWVDVTDGTNWWYATTTDTGTTTASNYVYTTGGVVYDTLTVDSVIADNNSVTPDSSDYYQVNTTKITISGMASADKVYIYNSTTSNYATVSANVTEGEYTADVDVYNGYNWISISDNFGNWAYLNVYNSGTGATAAVDYIYDVKVDSKGPDTTGGSTYTVTASSVTISGKLKNSGNGWWYATGTMNYESGTLWENNLSFSFPIRVDSGTNNVYLYDANWNYKSITISNGAATTDISQVHAITTIEGAPHTAQQYDYYPHTATSCSFSIEGKSTVSAGKDIYLYLSNYTASVYDTLTTTADMSGNYKFLVNIGSGTNYIDIYDYNWNWQGAMITGLSTCTITTVDLTAEVWSGTSQLTGVYDYYDAVASTSVTIKGKAKSGKTVSISLSNYTSNYYDYRSVTAAADNTYTLTLDIAKGDNYISLGDGYNWRYITVKTTGALNTVTFTADVYSGTPAAILDLMSGWYYNAGATTSVTIKGSAKSGKSVNISVSNYDTYPSYYDKFSTTASATGGPEGKDGYSVSVTIAKGYNYLSVDDGSTWLWLTVYSTSTATVSTVNFTANVYKGAGDTTAIALVSGSYDAGTNTSVTIKGDAKSGRTVSLSLSNYDSAYYDYLSVTAGSDNKYLLTLSLANGKNELTVNDGYTWLYMTVKTSITGTAVTAVTLDVDQVLAGTTVLPAPYTSGNANYYYDAGTSTSVTIKGSAKSGKTVSISLSNYDAYPYYYDYVSATALSDNTYSINISLANGYNSLSISDGSMTYISLTIKTSITTTVTAVTLDVDEVLAGTTNIYYDSYYYGYYAGSAESVTIKGSAKAGRTVNVELENCWTYPCSYNHFSTTAISDNTYSITISIASGYNYLDISDGNTTVYTTVYTYIMATTTPINLTAEIWANNVMQSPSYVGGTYYDVGNADTITVKGSAKVGKIVYVKLENYDVYPYIYNNYSTTAGSDNKYSIDIPLVKGYNYVYVNDGVTWLYLYVNTTATKKLVAITYPTNGSTVTGSVTVTGKIDKLSFTPTYIEGYIGDYNSYNYQYFSWGTNPYSYYYSYYTYGSLTYDSTTGNFSFTGTISGSGNNSYISVYAYDSNMKSHGHSIYVNTGSCTWCSEYSYKPKDGAAANR